MKVRRTILVCLSSALSNDREKTCTRRVRPGHQFLSPSDRDRTAWGIYSLYRPSETLDSVENGKKILTRIAAPSDVILITAISALSVRVEAELAVLHRASNLIVVALVSALLGQPLVACVTPGEAMTAVEHDCCMKMASMCESSAMPDSHSCCKHAVSPQIIAIAKILNGDIAIPAVLVSETTPILSLSRYARDFHQSNSPPESPPKFSTVLRI